MFRAKISESVPLTNMGAPRATSATRDTFRFENLGYYQVIDSGTYYYPAWKHYGRPTTILCDRCNRQDLKACIGWSQYDLCLICVDELTRTQCVNRRCNVATSINNNRIAAERGTYSDMNLLSKQ